MTAGVGIVVFPGSNCEQDCERALRGLGADTTRVWHGEERLPDVDLVVLPGGFAHGDYLRTGALARFSPIMDAVAGFAGDGGLVLGICNGFQILCEAGLLPGAMRKNAGLKFLCRFEDLIVANEGSALTSRARRGDVLSVPINHFEGNWYAASETVDDMRAAGQIVLRYRNNPNGSLDDVAGISNRTGNVFGLMPHPERACNEVMGSGDGEILFGSLLDRVGTRTNA